MYAGQNNENMPQKYNHSVIVDPTNNSNIFNQVDNFPTDYTSNNGCFAQFPKGNKHNNNETNMQII